MTGRGLAKRLAPAGMWVWLLGAGGFGLGYAVATWVPRSTQTPCRLLPGGDHCFFFSNIPQFHIWAALVGAQTALWAALLPGVWVATADLRAIVDPANRSRIRVAYALFSLFVLGAGGLILGLVKPAPPIAYFGGRVLVLTLLGLVTVAPAAMGMWMILVVLRRIHEEANDRTPGARPVAGAEAKAISDMRRTLKLVLSYMGAVIGSVALSTGALRNAVLAWDRMSTPPPARITGGYDFPAEFVVLYAIFFVVLLALVYVPVYLSLERTGREVLNAVLPIDWESDPGVEWFARREALRDFLQLGVRLEESLRAGLAILAPLVGLLVSTFLPGPKP